MNIYQFVANKFDNNNITAELVAKSSKKKIFPKSKNKIHYWLETCPEDNGRTSIVSINNQKEIKNITGINHDVRSRVHEYGGGSYTVSDNLIFFINESDQDIYIIDKNTSKLTNQKSLRYADLEYSDSLNNLYFIIEDHSNIKSSKPKNYIGFIDLDKKNAPKEIVTGRDFYSNPRMSKNGKYLAWLEWDLPHMPWDASELWVGEVDKIGNLHDKRKIDGGIKRPVFQPEWSDDNKLYYVSKNNDFGNIFLWNGKKKNLVISIDGDFYRPQWVFGMSSYKVISNDMILGSMWKNGLMHLVLINIKLKEWRIIPNKMKNIDDIEITNDLIILSGSTKDISNDIFYIRKKDINNIPLSEGPVDKNIIKINHKKHSVYGLHYPPNKNIYQNSYPLIISIHGGPTSISKRGYSIEREYWRSKGLGILEIDYRGSIGYGIKYRDSLYGYWGIKDVEDVIAFANHMIKESSYDKNKIILRGSSSAGLTILNTLIKTNIFACAASYYGVADLEKLYADTHKFESGYLESLIGYDFNTKEGKDVFKKRSPLSNCDKIKSPIIFFQGLKDRVVPPSQTKTIVNALNRNNIYNEFYEFKNEGHGFRSKETIVRSLNLEFEFYKRILSLKSID
ncbi:MAG: prolyl oligopeptidase family serine peptidase [Alphaproteobacteria bacterium]|jgi:dipeptidyl aminopeptidase/acylaminoacyl peptidase|tara:strand:- start:15265 stop:17130 length:1866 start_codon:yes stop_codon:yes gene_type:complete